MHYDNVILLAVIFVMTTIVSLVLTGFLRFYAINNRLIDIPNERSSHSIATPRGGGLSFVLVFTIGLIALYILYPMYNVLISFAGASILVALVGFVDDHGHIAPRWRLVGHFIAATWAVMWLGGLPPITILGDTYHLGTVGYILVIIALVWLLNLYNFMDGIDGIAASEAIFVAGSGLIFAIVSGNAHMQLVAMLIISSTLGFLFWNWPPAKIFMGDVGSGFLGIVLGIYALWAMTVEVTTVWTWLIVFGVFIVDATVTLIRRFQQGLVWYEAHRSHAYQHAARRWGHLRVTLGVNIINFLWLLPIAYISNIYRSWGFELTLLANIPLVVLVSFLKAGKELK